MSRRYRRRDDVAFQSLLDQVVIVNARAREVHVLNGTASRIWGLLERETSVAELAGALRAEYAVEASRAEAEVESFLLELQEKCLAAALP
jgi:hypothetical protein